jgi:hypothetical protein
MNEKKSKTKLLNRIISVFLSLGIGISSAQAVRAQEKQNDVSAGDLLEMLGTIVNFFQNFQIPDLGEIFTSILNAPEPEKAEDDTQAMQASKILENKYGTYAMKKGEAEAAAREAVLKAMQEATLDETAQKRIKETSQKVDDNVKKDQELAKESQSIDVTQQILQNLSQQQGLNAEREGIIVQQNQQAQVDRAIANVLNTKQLEQLSEVNTGNRREAMAAYNHSVSQMGLIGMPGLICSSTPEDKNTIAPIKKHECP